MSRALEKLKEGGISKRKRDIIPENENDKLEIDVNLPEPPSKKAKRKEKKEAKRPTTSIKKSEDAPKDIEVGHVESEQDESTQSTIVPQRSEHGIWIGNLPFSVTKDSLRQFLKDEGSIDGADVTRVHLPSGDKGQNKGFAYVDFTTPAVLQIALALSEKMIVGRRVLIKNAKSFEGRPERGIIAGKKGDATGDEGNGKEPSKRIFVGNLSFEVTKDELADHFSQAGQVEEVFIATFQDTGKCKGFGWVRFAEIEAAANAVKGYIYKESEDQDDADGEDQADLPEDESARSRPQKSKKPRKWFINRIYGRTLRCEFAEDPQTRYKKRFGQKPITASNGTTTGPTDDAVGDVSNTTSRPSTATEKQRHRKLDKDGRQEERRKRFDARKIAPGMALAAAPRATGAIVASAGSKVTFD